MGGAFKKSGYGTGLTQRVKGKMEWAPVQYHSDHGTSKEVDGDLPIFLTHSDPSDLKSLILIMI